ncbi:MAG: hypothetical protein LQ349_006205 [Xanthoria aureola]|nr:MAG: hypothetical protein LQ349_006205 [Xanthoria aureola]
MYLAPLRLLTVYRLIFHPLAKFPGPKLAAATRLYEAYYDVLQGGKYIFQIGELHKQYGKSCREPLTPRPIVRISPHELHVNDPTYHTTLYSHIGRWDKYDFAFKPFQRPCAGFSTIDHDDHQKRRAALAPFFSKEKVSEREPFLREQVKLLVGRVERNVASRELLDIGKAYAAFSMDIATGYALGSTIGNLDRTDFNKDLANFFTDFGPLWVLGKHVPLLPWLFRRAPEWMLSCLGDRLAAYKAFSQTNLAQVRLVMSESKQAATDTKGHITIIHELLKADGLPRTSSREQDLFDESDIVLSGGTEALRTLRVLTYHLCANPKILTRLREELDKAAPVGSKTPLSLHELRKLPFLTAVITEGTRLSYGAVTRLQRIVPDRTTRYGDWTIPAGTPVGISHGLIFYDEEYFPDSHSFIPERWLDPKETAKLDTVFTPFGRGPRMCLGVNLAWAELYLSVSALFSKFDMELYKTTIKDI